jgi:class 3 adenylate cyclase
VSAGEERKLVTVLFADLVGSTAYAGDRDPERVRAQLEPFYDAMREAIELTGGTVEKFAGDAVMAVFGAPDPVPDHAERALRCAMAMQLRQEELNREGWGAVIPSLDMGIGVNTGTVIAGTIGGGGRLEYTVVGDAVNVAQRLQSEAGGGEIVATADTIAAAPEIAVEFIGSRQVKGRTEPVDAYRVLG